MTNTFTHIVTVTLSSPTSVITISNIPQTFRHLRFHWQGGVDNSNANIHLQMNGSRSGDSFMWQQLFSNGTWVASSFLAFGSDTNTLNHGGVATIMDYTVDGRVKNYTSLIHDGDSYGQTLAQGFGATTSPVTSIGIQAVSGFGGSMIAGTRIDLYGVVA